MVFSIYQIANQNDKAFMKNYPLISNATAESILIVCYKKKTNPVCLETNI